METKRCKKPKPFCTKSRKVEDLDYDVTQGKAARLTISQKSFFCCIVVLLCVCGGPHDLDYWELCSAIGQKGERYTGVIEKDVIEGRGEGERRGCLPNAAMITSTSNIAKS